MEVDLATAGFLPVLVVDLAVVLATEVDLVAVAAVTDLVTDLVAVVELDLVTPEEGWLVAEGYWVEVFFATEFALVDFVDFFVRGLDLAAAADLVAVTDLAAMVVIDVETAEVEAVMARVFFWLRFARTRSDTRSCSDEFFRYCCMIECTSHAP
jgi:hypothetical protein